MTRQLIAVVEDEPLISEVVATSLTDAGYDVMVLGDGEAAIAAFVEKMPELIILDWMLPKIDGYAVLQWLREKSDVPVIMLTARFEEKDRVAGLESGADDYVVKPFSPKELLSRVRAVLRRVKIEPDAVGIGPINYRDLSIDPFARTAKLQDNPIRLTVKEFDLLWWLMSHPGKIFSREELLEAIWGISEYIDPNTVTVHMRRLRMKIEEDPDNPRRLITVWGVGYRFEV